MNISEPRHRWRCVEITTRPHGDGYDGPLSGLVESHKAGICVLYTHNRHILWGSVPESAAIAVREALPETEREEAIEIPDWRGIETAAPTSTWRPGARILLLRPDRADSDGATTIYSALRKTLGEGGLKDPLFILASSNVWDYLHDPGALSQLVADPQVREYLLWDDCGLYDSRDGLADAEAWPGAGWIGPRARDLAGRDALRLPSVLSKDFHDGLRVLADLQRRGTDHSGSVMVQREVDYYLSILGGFLPQFKATEDRWLPAMPGQFGGVRGWRGMDDLALDSGVRQLLLDGWLTLWKSSNGYAYQPSSLVLLYWVAQELRKRHAQEPQAFLDNYAWRRSGWFEGRWPGSDTATDEEPQDPASPAPTTRS